MKNALITTTINIPENIADYARDIAEHGPVDTKIIVAGDEKTPLECDRFLRDLVKEHQVPIEYLNPRKQTEYLEEIGATEYGNFLPWNCIQRRNIAVLYAYKKGAEIIATIDDDNYFEGEGYFKQHGNLGSTEALTLLSSDNGWFNPCDEHSFYPRGFSFKNRRSSISPDITESSKSGRRVVNGGLWVGDPDIDAVTRMATNPDVEEYTHLSLSFVSPKEVLAPNTKCPFNSQNTALHRDVIPAYCLATGLGRYDDIIASYVVKRVADHLGDYISFGEPLVKQKRNKHNIWKDFEEERIGMQLTDQFVDWLYEIELTKTTYRECTAELMLGLHDKFKTGERPAEQNDFFNSILRNYALWLKIV